MITYNDVVADISKLADYIQYFSTEADNAKKDLEIKGNLQKLLSVMPGITEYRFNQLQNIEALLQWMELELKKIRRKYFQKYLENYNKALSAREAEKYTDGEQEVVDWEMLINELSYIRNRYLGIIKGLESKNFMIGHIARLRVAGFDDLVI